MRKLEAYSPFASTGLRLLRRLNVLLATDERQIENLREKQEKLFSVLQETFAEADDVDEQDDGRQNVGEIPDNAFGQFEAVARIGLFIEFFQSPAPFMRTEENNAEGA